MGWTDVVRLEVVNGAAPLAGVDALFDNGYQSGKPPSQTLGDPPAK